MPVKTNLPRKRFRHEKLYLLRINKGLRLEDLAKRIGCDTVSVHFWEMGRCKPNPGNMLRLAKTFKVKPEYFFSAA